ncbi:TetR/AcrR family transcriptional regulator [Rhizohabitans arisaemae]|uniref:TetR/AcrR family transcriptional regulator n=1 Tax=Rhizohabitans arisaemae TaxID=2720610 RepID=UPI0024B07DDA|nr:TetR/AcrR family transcriptional regulator [Rhizohabitans arisaemae]
MTKSSPERILTEALRLFAERGYWVTSVADIEAASGLSPGAGGLYRHFRSKYEVLVAVIDAHTAHAEGLHAVCAARGESDGTLESRLRRICEDGLAAMVRHRKINQVLFRDLGRFPELVEIIREGMLQPMYDAMAAWFKAQPEYSEVEADWQAISAVLGGSVVHYWMFQETVTEPPGRVEAERFVAAWVSLALGLLGQARAAGVETAVEVGTVGE